MTFHVFNYPAELGYLYSSVLKSSLF